MFLNNRTLLLGMCYKQLQIILVELAIILKMFSYWGSSGFPSYSVFLNIISCYPVWFYLLQLILRKWTDCGTMCTIGNSCRSCHVEGFWHWDIAEQREYELEGGWMRRASIFQSVAGPHMVSLAPPKSPACSLPTEVIFSIQEPSFLISCFPSHFPVSWDQCSILAGVKFTEVSWLL